MLHNQELIIGAVGLVATLAVRVVTVNRLIRSKLRLSLVAFAAYLGVSALLMSGALAPASAVQFLSVAHLLLALGVVTLLVVSAINPWRVDHTPEHFPSIVQDSIIIGIFLVIGTGVMQEKFLTTSAVGAVVIGLAIQDTLGNTFAGLAIQVEKPFRVDQWVRIGSFEGRVAAITWRATRLITKNGDAVVVPNNVVSKEAIVNYSEPEPRTRLMVDVGASYHSAPNQVKAVIREALADAKLVLRDPAPEVVLSEFGPSSIHYLIKFWIADWGGDDPARDQVRSSVYYAFRRNGIEIPFPTQVHYLARLVSTSLVSDEERQAFIDAVDLFRQLSDQDRAHLSSVARERLYGAGQAIVRQDASGDSMFVVGRGTVRVTITPGDTEVATIPAGGFFGEMSLLTGQPRTANVSAVGDCLLLEIGAADFRQIALAQPAALEQVMSAVAQRQAGLARSREVVASAAATVEVPRSFLLKVREFLKL